MTTLYLLKIEDMLNTKTVPSNERALSAIGASLMCYAVSEMLCVPKENTVISKTELGAPYVRDHNAKVSLSHSHGVVACAVSDDAVGVDVEKIRKVSDGVMRHLFSDAEKTAVLDSENSDLSFIQYWTYKEAYGKLHGTGLRDFDTLMDIENRCSQENLHITSMTVFDEFICSVVSRDKTIRTVYITRHELARNLHNS